MTNYAFDNAWNKARQRLASIEALYDPGTFRHLADCGLTAGWHCLEVGGGGGSVVAWLCEQVGPAGHVLATDIDTRFLEALHYPNLKVQRHDIVNDPLPQAAFDLVHSRMVIGHLPERDRALRQMVSAVKPGGWLVCELLDGVSATLVAPADDASLALYAKLQGAVARVMAARGHRGNLGRSLTVLLRAQGLVEVKGEGRVFLQHTGPETEFARLTLEQLQPEIVAAGSATSADFDAYFAMLADPAYVAVGPTVFAAWGRRPPS